MQTLHHSDEHETFMTLSASNENTKFLYCRFVILLCIVLTDVQIDVLTE